MSSVKYYYDIFCSGSKIREAKTVKKYLSTKFLFFLDIV